MEKFFKTFELRWSDLDANRHLANTSILSYMVHTRMAFMEQYGFGQDQLRQLEIGPAILQESMTYLREVLPGEKVTVDIELNGHSQDFRFFSFSHNMFKESGEQAAYCTLVFCFIGLNSRKMIVAPDQIIDLYLQMNRSTNFTIITKEDTAAIKAVPASALPGNTLN